MRKTICILGALLVSCAHQSQNSVASQPKPSRGAAMRSEALRASAERREFQKEKALVVAKKQKGRTPAAIAGAQPQTKRLTMTAPSGISVSKKISEVKLLAELQEQFDRNNELGFQARYQALQQRFPKSKRLNEAHYMAGLMHLGSKSYGRSLKAFDSVLKNKPTESQAAGAMFAKAMTFKRMNLMDQVAPLLRQVQVKYPKTFEAQRAALELKILEKRFQ